MNIHQRTIVNNVKRRGFNIDKTPECSARQAAKLFEEVLELVKHIDGYPIDVTELFLHAKDTFKSGKCGKIENSIDVQKEISDVIITLSMLLHTYGIDIDDAIVWASDKSSSDISRGVK